jgi:hypothetical protein
MNERHKICKKVNRVKRLNNKIKNAPLDDNKIQRRNGLLYELGKIGVKNV